MGPSLLPSHTGSEIANLAAQQISCINNFCYVRERVNALSTTSSTSCGSGGLTNMWLEQYSILNLDSRRAKAIMALTDHYSPKKAAEVLWNSSSSRTRGLSEVRTEAVDILFQTESMSQHSVRSVDGTSPSPRDQLCGSTKDNEFTIAEFLRPRTRRNIYLTLNSACETYIDVVLTPMAKVIEDDVTDLGQYGRSPSQQLQTSQLPYKSCRKLKNKFGNWNEMWEEVGCYWFIFFTSFLL